jgi:hypothetical protein
MVPDATLCAKLPLTPASDATAARLNITHRRVHLF